MKTSGSVLLVSAAMLLSSAAYAAELLKSPEDAETFNTCKAMKPAERNASTACKAVMQKTKVTSSDMDKMQHCESPQTDVNKDPACKAVMAKHPELTRGHGRLDMDTDINTPVPGTNGQAVPPKSN